MGSLRKFMRGVILPVKEIKCAINTCLAEYKKGAVIPPSFDDEKTVLDFGSGTLFWSEWFQKAFGAKVVAFDTAYRDKKIFENLKNKNPKIICSYDFSDIENKKFGIIFACDVLHHVGRRELFKVLENFSKMSGFIVIKDIEAGDKIGNLQNKIHDFLINREIVCDIYSDELAKFLKDKGFEVRYFMYKKAGYPHFLLIAFRTSL